MKLFEAKPIFRFVYHICYVGNIPKIQREGLIPHAKSPGEGWSHLKYEHPSIFVITRKSKDVINDVLGMLTNKYDKEVDLDGWSEDRWDRFVKSHRLLTIDLSKCGNIELYPDPNTEPWTHSKRIIQPIPPEAIVNIEPVNFDWT